MSWFKIDDRLPFHPKILSAGNSAVGAWVRMGAYSAAHGLDGVVPDDIAKLLASPADLAACLKTELLHKHAQGYELHDYLDYNPPSAKVAERRNIRQIAGSKGGKKSAETRRQRPDLDVDETPTIADTDEANHQANASAPATVVASHEPKQTGEANGQAHGAANGQHLLRTNLNPVPSRPDPDPVCDPDARATPPTDQTTHIHPLEARWREMSGIKLLDPVGMARATNLIRRYAETTGRAVEEVQVEALAAFKSHVATWDTPQPLTPSLFYAKWEQVQATMAQMYAPRERRAGQPPSIDELQRRGREPTTDGT